MLAWNLFKKSILLIADNLGAALKVTLVPYAILAAASFYFADQTDVSWLLSAQPGEVPDIPPGFGTAIMVSLFVQLTVYIWIAVGWHRYVLLEEGGEGWLPPLRGSEMLGYLGRSMLLVLVMTGVGVVVTLVLSLLAPFLVAPVFMVLGFIVFYRLGLILPAGAIGQPIQMGAAWAATRGQSGTVVMLALLTFFMSIVLQVPSMLAAGGGVTADGAGTGALAQGAQPGVLGLLYSLVVGWIVLMVGVGVLSTLYGHFVEGRRLD